MSINRRIGRLLAIAAATLSIVAGIALAETTDRRAPLTGDAFLAWVAAQDPTLQSHLHGLFPAEEGYMVTGALEAARAVPGDERALLHLVRVVCPTAESYARARAIAGKQARKRSDKYFWNDVGYTGGIHRARIDGADHRYLLMTMQQLRHLMWYRDVTVANPALADDKAFGKLAVAVGEHLNDTDDKDTPVPSAHEFELADDVGLYPERPAYVIEGYQNYKDFLIAHDDVATTFADSIEAFIPGEELLERMIREAPAVAYPNKEYPIIQHEFKKFTERGGTIAAIHELTAETLAALVPGEYFYGVGMSGRVRFGYETPREEVERVESETGKKLARANHAFLFPGEPLLSAGAFFVETRAGAPVIVAANTQSGHYFYSNLSPTVRDDIAVRSNAYLMSIGHFLAALQGLGAPLDRILISKM